MGRLEREWAKRVFIPNKFPIENRKEKMADQKYVILMAFIVAVVLAIIGCMFLPSFIIKTTIISNMPTPEVQSMPVDYGILVLIAIIVSACIGSFIGISILIYAIRLHDKSKKEKLKEAMRRDKIRAKALLRSVKKKDDDLENCIEKPHDIEIPPELEGKIQVQLDEDQDQPSPF